MKIMQRHVPSYAKPSATRHGLRQARQVGPDVAIKLANDKVAPITTSPFRRRFLESGPTLSAPGSQERVFFSGAKGSFEEIEIKHIIVIHENQQISS
jgi:hypothetical protein